MFLVRTKAFSCFAIALVGRRSALRGRLFQGETEKSSNLPARARVELYVYFVPVLSGEVPGRRRASPSCRLPCCRFRLDLVLPPVAAEADDSAVAVGHCGGGGVQGDRGGGERLDRPRRSGTETAAEAEGSDMGGGGFR